MYREKKEEKQFSTFSFQAAAAAPTLTTSR